MRRLIAIVLATLAALVGITLTAGSASAASGDEIYQCPLDGIIGNTAYWHCNGTWYNGAPGVRTFNSYVTEAYDSDGTSTTGVQNISSYDGRAHVAYWYCSYFNGTTSGLKGTTQVGGALPNTYTWPSGYFPCNGNEVGIVADVRGYYGSTYYISKLYWNTNAFAGQGKQSAHPWRTA